MHNQNTSEGNTRRERTAGSRGRLLRHAACGAECGGERGLPKRRDEVAQTRELELARFGWRRIARARASAHRTLPRELDG
jgi:hypothetical protein